MDRTELETRLRCAVVAGWWTLLGGWGLAAISWIFLMAASKSAGFADFISACWGGVPFQEMRPLWVIFLAVTKLIVFADFMIVLFLTFWLRQLRKANNA